MLRRLLGLPQKKRRTLILALLLVLAVSMRLPTTPHVFFQDSYASLWKAGKIVNLGYAVDDAARPWRVDYSKLRNLPSSIPGVFQSMEKLKASYPLPPPVLNHVGFAAYVLVTGLSAEHAALSYSILYGLLGCIGAYYLARELSRDRAVHYFVAFFYSTAPVFVSFTSWTFLARAPLMGLLPFLFLFLIRLKRTRKLKYLLLGAIVGVSLILTHKIGLISLPVYALYALSFLLSSYARKRGRWRRVSRAVPYAFAASAILLLSLPFIWKSGVFRQALWEYQWGYLINGAGKSGVIFNILVDYHSSLGILTFFALMGFIELAFTLRKGRFNEFFTASYILLLSPIAVYGGYTRLLLLPVSSHLTALGLRKTINFISSLRIRDDGKTITASITATSLLLSTAFALSMTGHWITTTKVPYLPQSQWIDGRILKTINYAKDLNGTVLAPVSFISWSTYIAPYLSDDDKVAYLYDFISINPPEDVDVYIALRNLTHVLESRETRKYWLYPTEAPSDADLMERVHETQDHIFSDGLVDVWNAYNVPASMTQGDLTGAFAGPETVVGLSDGRLYALTSDGKVIVPLKRDLGAGITAVAAGDFTTRGLDDLAVGLSNGLVMLLDNSGRLVWNHSLGNGTASHISSISLTGMEHAGILVESSSGRQFVLDSSGDLAYILP